MRRVPTAAEEQDLIRRARYRAGGADVHQVANLCAAYHLYVKMVMAGEVDAAQGFEEVSTRLQAYVRTGRLPRQDN